jgi:hypothetical protein
MAAVLACEPGAWISHDSAGWFYRLLDEPLEIHVDAGPTWRWGGASVARPTHVQAHSLAARTALPPDRSLVVETDSLRYHRTATQQTKDMLRDQRHTAAGLTCLRFSHYQVAHERDYVRATLTTVARRLQPAGLAYGV